MKIIFLGTAGSAPIRGRNNLSLLIKFKNDGMLVDCSGCPATEILKYRLRVDELSEVFLTHHHADHIYALPSLIHNYWLNNGLSPGKKLTVTGTLETITFAKKLLLLFELESKLNSIKITWKILPDLPNQIVREGGEIKKICSYPVTHSNTSCIGLKIMSLNDESLVFTSDSIVDEKMDSLVKDKTDHLIADCGAGLYSNKGHSGVLDIAAFAQEKMVSNLYLTHLPQENILSVNEIINQAKKIYTGNVFVPNDGFSIEMN